MTDSVSNSKQLFPLRLTAFEQFMDADDTPDYPMTFFIEIGVTGQLKKQEFDDACQAAMQRHPLLSAILRRSWGRLNWVPKSRPTIVRWCESADEMPSAENRYIDLRVESGLRISVEHHPHESRIAFQFHHAATDGIGAIHFIGDVLAGYGSATASSDEERPQFVDVDMTCLNERGQRWEKGKGPPRLLRQWIYRVVQVLSAHPCSIRRHTAAIDNTDKKRALFLTHFLERAEVKALNAEAARRTATANELLALAMFQTLHEWNQHANRNVNGDIFRIALPASMRTPDLQYCPAANIVSYILLTRRGRDIPQAKSLLEYITTESKQVLIGRESGLVLLSMEAGCVIPGLLRCALRLPLRFATTVLANVGDVKRQLRNRFPLRRGKCVAGNVTLDYLVGAAPVRKGTHVATSVGKYAGRFIINLNCDSKIFTNDEANEFAESFLSHVRKLARLPSTSVPTTRSTAASHQDPIITAAHGTELK